MTGPVRIRRLVALTLFAALLAVQTVARAQESVNIIMPQARQAVVAPRHGQPVRLTGVEAIVTINDQVATTTLVMTLHNPSGMQQEAQVLLPVPQGAVVRSFQLDSLGTEPTAKLLPRDEARKIYDEIVRRMKDPGILEFVGYNQIRSSVFPIPAGKEERVRLTYEHLLTAASGGGGAKGTRVEYELPRSTAGAGVDWTVAAEIKSARPIATVYSATHDIDIQKHSATHATVKVTGDGGAGPVQIAYLLEKSGGDGITASLIAYPDAALGEGKGGYFMLLAALPDEARSSAKIRRELTIVIDRSGSMQGEKMVQAREAARQVVEGLEDGEAFNIIDFSSDVQMFAPRPVVKDRKSIGEARAYLEAIRAEGGTNIHDALVEALRQPPTEGMLPVVLFLTDGQATVGRTAEREIREAAEKANSHERRMFTFGVGHDVNAPLLSGLARQSRAMSTFVLPGENVEVKVSQVFHKLAGPVLASPVLTVLDENGNPTTRVLRELQPPILPDVFEGDQVLVLGQYTREGPVKLRLSGNYRGEERIFEFTLDTADASTRHAYVPRLWANRKIAALIEEVRATGEDPRRTNAAEDPRLKELVDEIVRLSLRFGILTEFTAFLAVEPDAEGRFAAAPPAPAEAAPATVLYTLSTSREERAGQRAVEQQKALDDQRLSMNLGQMNRQYADGFARRSRQSVQHVGDRSLFLRGTRWVDGQLFMQESEEPDVIVEFGTPAYDELVEKLTTQNLQGLIANAGETYLLLEGQRVLVRGPG